MSFKKKVQPCLFVNYTSIKLGRGKKVQLRKEILCRSRERDRFTHTNMERRLYILFSLKKKKQEEIMYLSQLEL